MSPSTSDSSGNSREKEFLKRLLATFKIEAREHIDHIASGLLKLEKEIQPEKQQETLNLIYREAHSLKGASRAVDLSDVEQICQLLESQFKDFKNRGIPADTLQFDLLQEAVNTIDTIVSGDRSIDIEPLLNRLEQMKHIESLNAIAETISPKPSTGRFTRKGFLKGPQTPTPPSPQKGTSLDDTDTTIRVPVKKLDRLLLQAEEMISIKLSVNRRLKEMKESLLLLEEMKKSTGIASSRLKNLEKVSEQGPQANSTDALKQLRQYLGQQQENIKTLHLQANQINRRLQQDHRAFDHMVDAHLEDMRQTLMMPFSTITESFPRMMRELARQKNKEVRFVIDGDSVEIDKRILETIKNPLIHLLRNALDHGIEPPDQRKQLQKAPEGLIQVVIRQKDNNKVDISVTDDGRGISPEKVKQKAIDSGKYTPSELNKMQTPELYDLIFNPEFSTTQKITEISGRGLGLAIVREKVEKLGGRIQIDSQPEQGTTFRLELQASLATFRGILVQCMGQKFIIPTLNVKQVTKLSSNAIKTVENRETIDIGGTLLSFVSLAQVLGLATKPITHGAQDQIQLVILGAGERRIAFHVDVVLDEQEVLVKELGKQLERVENISGATVLGTGDVVLILNTLDLLKNAIKKSSSVITAPSETKKKGKGKSPKTKPDTRQASVLVVEDSITSRMLLKNILESSGYRVRVAVDGQDGWIALNEEPFQLAVLDVEMPGMNGFQLTQKIRQHKNLAHMPVVLVTSLESREDREKGIEVGADAYIVKSSFHQSNLLEIIKKLV